METRQSKKYILGERGSPMNDLVTRSSISPKSMSPKSMSFKSMTPNRSSPKRSSPKRSSPQKSMSFKSMTPQRSLLKRSSLKQSSLKRSSLKRKNSSPQSKMNKSKRIKRRTSSIKRSAAKKIVRFFRQTKHTRKARFLQALCSDAGVCLAFGKLTDEIKKHFGGFTEFNYVVPPIKRIGADSVNGFINQIEYDHRGYKSYAILKSAKTINADNLLYEYIVGQYVNKLNKHYPCFLETYGYYIYNYEEAWTQMQEKQIDDVSILKNGLSLQSYPDYNDACRESRNLAILIQHLKDIKALGDLARDETFIENEMMWVLFQLYIPLAKLKNNFTHYDLHLDNLYLYKPVEGKYIEYHYYISSSRAITFKSCYMLKIIDYGRSFFKDETANSKQIYDEELCEYATDCNEPDSSGECGDQVGFAWLAKPGANPAKNFYISSQKRNMSHDLLPLTRILESHTAPRTNKLTPELKALLGKVVYTDYFGTAELAMTGYPHAIYNVQDASKTIMDYIMTKKCMDKNAEVYAGLEKLGDLHIYLNKQKPMHFVPA